MQELKKIGVLSTAKIFAFFGLVLGVISIIVQKVICSIDSTSAISYGVSCTSGWSSLLLGVVFAIITYALAGLIVAALYNIFARWVGGIKFDLGKKS
jgi:uncharacterized membrane protein